MEALKTLISSACEKEVPKNDIYETSDAREIFDTLPSNYFDILSLNVTNSDLPVIDLKVVMIGNNGSGKTTLVDFLRTRSIKSDYPETWGGSCSHSVWPFEHDGAFAFYRIGFWEAGYTIAKKFQYLVSKNIADAQVLLFLLAINDRTSYDFLKTAISKYETEATRGGRVVRKILMVTKLDTYGQAQVTHKEIEELVSSSGVDSVLPVSLQEESKTSHAKRPEDVKTIRSLLDAIIGLCL